LKLCNKAQNHDARNPDQAQDDSDAIEITLSNTGGTKGGTHAATKHVGNATSTTLVEQDKQGEQEASDTQNHLQNNLKNLHDSFLSKFR
jgi:hypothetical protein